MYKYRVLLGSIGDDAHSIGMMLLKIGLEERGYHVTFLGIQNTLDDFIKFSKNHDIIMISCVNGHSELYLNPESLGINQIKTSHEQIWYLGGNLSVNKHSDLVIKMYLEMGFTRVYPKPITLEETFYNMQYDIDKYGVKPKFIDSKALSIKKNLNISDADVKDDPIEVDSFKLEQKKVLHSWITGKDVSFDKAYKNYRKNKNMDSVLWYAHQNHSTPLIQPRTGVADIEKQEQLFQKLSKKNISIGSIQLDAASRRLYFDKAKEGVEKSILSETSMLNGFPVPIHGVNGVERLVNSINMPFQIRGGAPDHRFVYEVGIAGGASGIEGSFLCYLLPYEKMMNPIESLSYWKYVDRLCGIYLSKYNMVINREFFGALTTTLLEPSIPIVINIVEAILAAKQGVRSFSVGIAEQGNRIQDIAALHVLSKMTNYYLNKFGFMDTRVTTVFHQYMGAFPFDETKAEALITESAVTATLGGATRMMTKTPVEAFKIPSVEDNCRGIDCVVKGIKKASITSVDQSKVAREEKILEIEVISLMNYIEELGNGHISRGAIEALYQGIIDVPFSPNVYNKCDTVTFRNQDGAIRFALCNNLPFPTEIKEFHHSELMKRMNYERDNRMYSIIEKDLTRIWKGDYKKWPLDDTYLL